MSENKKRARLWISRLLIAAVTLMNLQAAFLFMLHPQDYAPGFEMSGVTGEAMVRGMGLLLLMWNIPYLFAALHPVRHFISLVEAVIMQFIGVTGESLILYGLRGQHPIVQTSVRRFIVFDGAGLVVLLAALLLVLQLKGGRRHMNAINGQQGDSA